jgi:hypothetical protein
VPYSDAPQFEIFGPGKPRRLLHPQHLDNHPLPSLPIELGSDYALCPNRQTLLGHQRKKLGLGIETKKIEESSVDDLWFKYLTDNPTSQTKTGYSTVISQKTFPHP